LKEAMAPKLLGNIINFLMMFICIKISNRKSIFRKDASPTHSHIFGKLPPFFLPQRSPQPESPIPNTAPWFNNPPPVFIPDRIYYSENKNCGSLSGIVNGICVKNILDRVFQ
jgi:hypothetical protein